MNTFNSNNSGERPGLLSTIAVITLTNGIVNLFWGFAASATVLHTIVGAICLPITILPTLLGVFEIIYAAKLLSNQPQPVKASPSLAWFEILTLSYGNVFSMAVGILNLIFFNDQHVKEYFGRINGPQAKVAVPEAGATAGLTIDRPTPSPTQSEVSAPQGS